MSRATFAFLACHVLVALAGAQPRTSVRYPWVYPGNFNERIRQADVIVSGTIVSTVAENTQVLNGVEVTSNKADIRADRIFKGRANARTVLFLWFSPAPVSGVGVISSLPPLAHFVKGKWYLVFLRRNQTGYIVIMPIYAIEVSLAPASPGRLSNLSQAPEQLRDSEIAQELETAALAVPRPQPGVTGEAVTYFPYVVDLIGGCAKPFLRHFAGSPSKELADSACSWLALISRKGLRCNAAMQ